jgi:8-oxo-dGTP diphosphatase
MASLFYYFLFLENRMDIKTLTEMMQGFVKSKGWYKQGSQREQSPRNLAISLCLEAAEVLEHFQWTDSCNNKKELGEELADVSLYLLQLASVSGIDLEKAILEKLSKNAKREWTEVL